MELLPEVRMLLAVWRRAQLDCSTMIIRRRGYGASKHVASLGRSGNLPELHENALLSRNASLCYRLDATLIHPKCKIRGDVTMDFLKDAKDEAFTLHASFIHNPGIDGTIGRYLTTLKNGTRIVSILLLVDQYSVLSTLIRLFLTHYRTHDSHERDLRVDDYLIGTLHNGYSQKEAALY
jgi:hypothetical protein